MAVGQSLGFWGEMSDCTRQPAGCVLQVQHRGSPHDTPAAQPWPQLPTSVLLLLTDPNQGRANSPAAQDARLLAQAALLISLVRNSLEVRAVPITPVAPGDTLRTCPVTPPSIFWAVNSCQLLPRARVSWAGCNSTTCICSPPDAPGERPQSCKRKQGCKGQTHGGGWRQPCRKCH